MQPLLKNPDPSSHKRAREIALFFVRRMPITNTPAGSAPSAGSMMIPERELPMIVGTNMGLLIAS